MRETISENEFCAQLDKRLDEVVAWAVMNCPIADANLAYADFEQALVVFKQVANGKHVDRKNQDQPEPEEGGPQYINDNPTPWP